MTTEDTWTCNRCGEDFPEGDIHINWTGTLCTGCRNDVWEEDYYGAG
jgi:formylmethanofuran dehydrogenase subunit E